MVTVVRERASHDPDIESKLISHTNQIIYYQYCVYTAITIEVAQTIEEVSSYHEELDIL